MKNRIWELDAARGICILGMLLIHLVYDLTLLYPILPMPTSAVFSFLQRWGGALFFLISGICATLGSHPVRRGMQLLFCGMLCSLATGLLVWLDLLPAALIIRFGVLHCLGCCMLLWPGFRRLSGSALVLSGLTVAALGFCFFHAPPVSLPFLYPIGLCRSDFSSGDYFPIFPFFGFFLLGAAAGKGWYRNKASLFPEADLRHPLLRSFLWCGVRSLPLYLLHQPVFALAAFTLYTVFW